MPTYEYQCSACGHRFEQFQSMKDKALRTCPSCKKPKLERLIGTGGAIIFKGGGFYQTDYRSESYKKSAEAEKSGSQSASGASAGEKSETKSKAESGASATPAAKAETPKPESKKSESTKSAGKKKAE